MLWALTRAVLLVKVLNLSFQALTSADTLPHRCFAFDRIASSSAAVKVHLLQGSPGGICELVLICGRPEEQGQGQGQGPGESSYRHLYTYLTRPPMESACGFLAWLMATAWTLCEGMFFCLGVFLRYQPHDKVSHVVQSSMKQ